MLNSGRSLTSGIATRHMILPFMSSRSSSPCGVRLGDEPCHVPFLFCLSLPKHRCGKLATPRKMHRPMMLLRGATLSQNRVLFLAMGPPPPCPSTAALYPARKPGQKRQSGSSKPSACQMEQTSLALTSDQHRQWHLGQAVGPSMLYIVTK